MVYFYYCIILNAHILAKYRAYLSGNPSTTQLNSTHQVSHWLCRSGARNFPEGGNLGFNILNTNNIGAFLAFNCYKMAKSVCGLINVVKVMSFASVIGFLIKI